MNLIPPDRFERSIKAESPVDEAESGVYTPTPSEQTYVPVLAAFGHFNTDLFNGKLPDVIITLQRKARTLGYFSRNKFAALKGDATAHEIALNPQHFRERTAKDTCSTLVHEMVHLQQTCFGKQRRAGYHDKQWASKRA